mmetsp:Transcript_9001/g.12424  ORF Transcript_9001/g.12424 Transcript_9001/m.12424 type:complete len:253 (+) Transcript_9001:93-851(+)
MAKMQVAHIGAKSLLLMLLASSVATLTAGSNTDCVTNAISFTLQMEYVNIDAINYASTMQTYVANALDTLSDCVTIQQPYAAGTTSTTATPARRRLSATSPSFSPGIAGVVPTMTTEQLQAALQTQNFKSQVCEQFGTDSSKCDITDVLAAPVTTIGTTTTTEMPWGWPWWVWFLIYCCCLAICGVCGGAGAGAAGGGGSKKKKSPNDNSRFDEPSRPQYEVVDVPGPGPHSGQHPPQQPPYNSGPQYSGYY